MSRNGLPDPKAIWTVAKDRRDSVYGRQQTLDEETVKQYLGTHVQDLYDPRQVKDIYAQQDMVKRVSLGANGSMVDQDVSVLHTKPFARILHSGGAAAERHASGTVEPWLNTAVWQGVSEPVWDRGVLDLRLIGVFWSKVLPAPQIIVAGLETMIDELNTMIEDGADEEMVKVQRERIEDWKRDHPAIVWRYVSPRGTFPVFDDEGMSEVSELRKLPYGAVVQMLEEMGEKLPEDLAKNKEIEALEYANDRYVATVLPPGGGVLGRFQRESFFLKEPWEHGLGVNPYVRIMGDPMPDNDEGWHYRGATFHLRKLLPAMDEVMSDLRTAFHAETVTPPGIKVDIEARVAHGWEEKNLDINPNETVKLLKDEEVFRFPTQQVNPDALRFIGLGQQFANQAGLYRPALTGAMASGQSAVGLEEARQIATGELKVPHGALEQGFAAVGDRFLRAVISLSRDFPEHLSEVTVLYEDKKNKSRAISVSADDVRPYIGRVRGKIVLNIPINEGAAVSNASIATNPQHPLLSDDSARERYYRHEDPIAEGDRIAEQGLTQGLLQVIQQVLTQRAQVGIQSLGAQGVQQLAQRTAQLPQAAQEAVSGRFPGMLENLTRGAANRTRAPQQMSELAGLNVSGPVQQ